MKNLKKTLICIIVAILMLQCFVGCENDERETDEKYKDETVDTSKSEEHSYSDETNEEEDTDSSFFDDATENNTDEKTELMTESETESEAEVYARYPNVQKIFPFYNGLAAFTVLNGDGYLYGYINVEGEVVIEPIFFSREEYAQPFEYPCISYGKMYSSPEYIIDKSGNTLYKVGENKVEEIGRVSRGYFWVKTLESETLSGNKYKMTYYSAYTFKSVVTFENASESGQSSIHNDGTASLVKDGEYFEFNIKDYDADYTPSVWPDINLYDIEAFKEASYRTACAQSDDKYSAVILTSSDNVKFYSIIDDEGNVVLQPQKDIGFAENSRFRNGICPAKDMKSGLWGYIDKDCNWVIEPQFSSANQFSDDGYAVVNDIAVINKNAEFVLKPAGYEKEEVSVLNGTYAIITRLETYEFVFNEDGNLRMKNYYTQLGSSSYNYHDCKYKIENGQLIISDCGKTPQFPPITNDGAYSFAKWGDIIYIDGAKCVPKR